SEYACIFAALGVEVHVVDGRDELLPFLDWEVSKRLHERMEALGIRFHFETMVNECRTKDSDWVHVALASGATIDADAVLVAAGRTSNTEKLGLEAAGITPGKRGLIEVDDNYRTAVPNIYAAGDVIGFPALASTSMEQARLAMVHAFDLKYKTEMAPILPFGIYTIPEVSMAGGAEEDLRAKGADIVVGRASYGENPRGLIVGDYTGFLKLVFNAGDMRLIGVHIVGELATELVHIGLMAMMTGQGADLFINSCFNYPTLSDVYKYATYDALGRRGKR
ncbi:MAG: FAD-dependent oxidoreductase, partial [Myxococcales bacterium]|nr:FAD-dependent oxidoreductase [Myxococcales bacterium]